MTNGKLNVKIEKELEMYHFKIVEQKKKDVSSDNEFDYSTLNYCQGRYDALNWVLINLGDK
jgi:hypothetical protein